jgi:predicted cation transporter
MSQVQVQAILMGLLTSGGMLIQGNIPNLISSSMLGIESKEWARLGVPLGLSLMLVYFVILISVL